MDEKAFRKGHNYLTLVNDFRGSRVTVLDFSTKWLFPGPFYPQILLQSRFFKALLGTPTVRTVSVRQYQL